MVLSASHSRRAYRFLEGSSDNNLPPEDIVGLSGAASCHLLNDGTSLRQKPNDRGGQLTVSFNRLSYV
jgi:hypothetical protein